MSEICVKLHKLFSKLNEFRFPFDAARIPQNGIYILFEKGELAHGMDRIVRIGTHNGNGNLLSRLNEHFITPNKDRSIFRKNIGRAILNENNDPFITHWNIKLSVVRANAGYTEDELTNIIERTQDIERQVTERIQRDFSFVVFEVAEQIERRTLESKIISTVSLCKDCSPSNNWFGRHSPKRKIRESGLWLIQGLYNKPSLSEKDYQNLEAMLLG